MSLITLQTTFTKNTSLQVGDIIYYLDKTTSPESVKKIGPVQTIADTYIVCTANGNLSGLAENSYIFFGKDNSKNTSGIVGYYAEVKLRNDSTSEAELFSASVDADASSK